MSLNNNLPCTKSIPVSLNRCFKLVCSFIFLTAKHFILVLLYCVNAVAVRFLLIVGGSLSLPGCTKPLFIKHCTSAHVSFT